MIVPNWVCLSSGFVSYSKCQSLADRMPGRASGRMRSRFTSPLKTSVNPRLCYFVRNGRCDASIAMLPVAGLEDLNFVFPMCSQLICLFSHEDSLLAMKSLYGYPEKLWRRSGTSTD